MNFESRKCRCDESGMDNSPRFDGDEQLDCIDASCFMVSDCRAMAGIFTLLGDEAEAAFFTELADRTAARINELLWDDARGIYCDRTFSGTLSDADTPASFLPMTVGICPPDRVERLVAHLRDPARFATPLPVPSISADHPLYGSDMWRGCVWLNYNYFIICGLRRCGHGALADTLREKTLQSVARWFEQTNNIYEFYDAEDRVRPEELPRKGEQPAVPDSAVHMHAITDYNWSACFTYILLTETEAWEEK